MRDKILKLIDKFKNNSPIQMAYTWELLQELKYKNADFLTKLCNITNISVFTGESESNQYGTNF